MKHLKKVVLPSLVVIAFIFSSFTESSAQTTFYSRQDGDWNSRFTWSTTSHAGAAATRYPGQGGNTTDIVLIGANDDVTIPSDANNINITIASITVSDDGNNASLSFGNDDDNDNDVITFTVTGDITINANGTVVADGDGDATHSLTVGGNLLNDGVFNMINAVPGTDDFVNVTFNGSASNTISGNGTFSFNNFSLNKNGNDLNVASNIRIQGVLNFASNGLLIVGSNSNITLDDNATITGASASRYIQLDGTTGTNSQLIRENGGDDADWEFLFPIGTAEGYTPLDTRTGSGANVAGTNPDNNSTLAVKVVYGASSIGKLRRTFRLVVQGNDNNTTFTNADFYYDDDDVSAGDVIDNYTTLWYFNSATGWSAVGGTAPGVGFFTAPDVAQPLSNGTYFYTIGISTAYPSVWYSYQNGVWSNPSVWTLDPSGTTLVNSLSQSPSAGDEVIILNGFTVTCDVDNLVLSKTTIEGGATLDMAATIGHNLGVIDGTGLLRINGINLPNGDFDNFVAATGGTIEYYNTGGFLSTTQEEYNNIILSNSTSSNITFINVDDLLINGDLEISQSDGSGTVTWQINNNTNDELEMTIAGDLTVSENGRIRVGTGNENSDDPHTLTISGNFTNNGSVKFFDDSDTELSETQYSNGNVYTNELQGNAVTVTFTGLEDMTVTCNGTTDFYRFVVNKGSNQQPKLTVTSSAAANFRLFGPANLAHNNAAIQNDEISLNALSIISGTLELTGTINIPVLCAEGAAAAGSDYFPIPRNGALWLNSPDVTVTIASSSTANQDQRVLFSGLLRVSNGTLNGGYSRGIGSAGGGTFLMEGGTVNIWQYRPLFDASNIFTYIQTGGTVNIGTTGQNGTPSLAGVSDFVTVQFARFSLPTPESVFQMSGGVLNIGTPTPGSAGSNAQAGGFDVQAASGNYKVTGGTVNIYVPTSGENFTIYSTAEIYDLNIFKAGAGGTLTASLNSELKVLNDLTLSNAVVAPRLNCNNNNLTVGGNFIISTGAVLSPGTNTITFNGAGAQAWINNGSILNLNNVVVNKSAGTLTLGGSNGTTDFPNITGTATGLTLLSGTLNDGGERITITGALNNSAVHTGNGQIYYNRTGASTIGGSNGIFGNLSINSNATVSLAGSQTVTGTLRLLNTNTTLNIGSYTLTVTGNIFSNGTAGTNFGNTKRILTLGLRNDGGLVRQASSGEDLLFPVGTPSIAYTPVTINVTASTMGTIAVRPVASQHPNATSNQSLQFFWRVTSEGFSDTVTVVHKSYTFSSATKSGTQTTYRPARYNPQNFTWAYRTATYNANGTTVIPDFSTGTGWTGLNVDVLDGEYTAGNSGAFGLVTVFYSRASGSWNAATTWSNTAVGSSDEASSAPCATCPVIIGDENNSHTVTIAGNNTTCGSLFIATGSTLDCSTFTGLNFGMNTSDGVKGRGTLRINSGTFPAGDFTNFIGENGGTVEWYGESKTIPATGSTPQSLVLDNYYNLIINPNNGATITLPASNVTVFNDFTISGTGTGQTNTNATGARTITVNNDLNITGRWSIRNGNTTNIILSKDMTIASGAIVSLQGGGTRTHTISTIGSINNNGTMTFRNGNEVVNITFTGDTDASLTGSNAGATTTLNTLTINKGSDKTPVLTLDVAGTVNTLNNGWLTLLNGTMDFNKTGGSFTLTNTATNFSIPSTARLLVRDGTVNIGSIANDAADLLLSGTLELTGGSVNIGVSTNDNNNDIEYASAGNPAIIVSGGTLYVNGGVRRSTQTLSGALVYDQTGGTVTIGGRDCDANDDRGVFEIEKNSGSSFTLKGNSVLTISRSSGGNVFADLYLNPATSDVDPTGTIRIGASNLGNQTLSVNIVPQVGNFQVMGAAGNAQTVNMGSSKLRTTGTLTINQASTLHTNSLDVNIGGDLAITGTYNGSNNTTTFDGSGAQAASLSATSTFLHMTVNKPDGTATLSGTSPTITNLNILSGTLDVSTIGLTVVGNVVNNSVQTGTGSITMAGASTNHTITSSGGIFTNLTLGGSATSKTVTVVGNMTVDGVLNFAAANRILKIGSYRLTLGSSSSVSGAGANSFIRTNGVSSDLGVVKNWPAGANTFVYPVGTMSNYTPVQFTLTVTSPGEITVIPVNSRHPSYGFTSTEQILNYYWIVRRNNSIAYNNNGSHVYSYASSLMGGSGGSLLAGYLNLSNPSGWVTNAHGGVASTTTMTYTNVLDINLPAASLTYHYTVGTSATLSPVIARVYSRFAGGNWTDLGSWTTDATGTGPAITAVQFPSGLVGTPVVILSGATITVDADSRVALATEIYGTLDIGASVGHDFGQISGTGTLRTRTNTFPAGDYTSFVSSAGGTIEYVAPVTMNNRVTYNNVNIIGTGSVTMTNTDIVLNGDLTIGSGTTLTNSANNSDITIAGDWATNGSFVPGTGVVILNGAVNQTVSGTTTFHGLTLAKAGGNLTLSGTGTTTVNGPLTLTNGHVISGSSHMLAFGTSASASGGSSSSFVSGPARKVMNAGSSFTYPIGSMAAGRYRPVTIAGTGAVDTWTVQYVDSNPFDPYAMNEVNIQKVSEFEYWDISHVSGSNSANLTLTYNTGSYNGSDIGNVANLRIAHWDGSQWDLPAGAGPYTQSGNNVAGSVTVTGVTDFSPFTLASLDLPSPLPLQWISFTADRLDNYTVELSWTTAHEHNNERFEVERSADGMNFFRIGSVAGAGSSKEQLSYQYLDTEASSSQRHYYRIRQVDYDGNFDFSDVLVLMETGEVGKRWMVSPNPVSEAQSLTLSNLNPMADSDEIVSIVIVSAGGQVVFERQGEFGDVSFSLEQFSSYVRSGVYVMRIVSGSYSETFRIVKF